MYSRNEKGNKMKLTKKGFTLVELMVVIVIVGILAAVAIPKFTMASHKAKASEFPTVLAQIFTAELAYEAETGSYATTFTSLGMGGDPTDQSTYFTYTVPNADASTGYAKATVKKDFGDAKEATPDTAGILFETGKKEATANLLKYATSWSTP